MTHIVNDTNDNSNSLQDLDMMIRPLFVGKVRPSITIAGRKFVLPFTVKRTWIGEPVEASRLTNLRNGAFDCAKSVYAGWVVA